MAISVGKVFSVFNADQNTGSSSGLAKVIGWAENVINVFDKLIKGLAYTLGLIKVISNPKNWLLGADETVALANEYAGIAAAGMPRAGARNVNRSSTPMNINFPVGGSSSLGAGTTVKAAANVSKAVKAASSAGVDNLSGMPSAMMPSGGYDSQLTKTEQNIYNFTVNGALDSESTARQIVSLLNDSQARGTLGASGLIGAVSF
jgi:hypothetical protein